MESLGRLAGKPICPRRQRTFTYSYPRLVLILLPVVAFHMLNVAFVYPAVGIVVVVHSSPQYGSSTLMNIPGLACAVLSLTTNLVATSLIAYKTW